MHPKPRPSRAHWQQLAAEALTPRRWEVIRLLPTGMTNLDIANALHTSENTIKSHVRLSSPLLWKFAGTAGVTTCNRTSIGVICLRTGQARATHAPTGWSLQMTQALTPLERAILQKSAEADASAARTAHLLQLSPPSLRMHARIIREKLMPYRYAAEVNDLDLGNMGKMLVRAGTIRTPEMRRKWQEDVQQRVSKKERPVLARVVKGLENTEIGAELGLSPLTIKSHLARITAKLTLYGPGIGVVRPTHRSGLATIAVLADLHS